MFIGPYNYLHAPSMITDIDLHKHLNAYSNRHHLTDRLLASVMNAFCYVSVINFNTRLTLIYGQKKKINITMPLWYLHYGFARGIYLKKKYYNQIKHTLFSECYTVDLYLHLQHLADA